MAACADVGYRLRAARRAGVRLARNWPTLKEAPFMPAPEPTLAYIGGPPGSESGRKGLPQDILTGPNGDVVFDLWSLGDVVLDLLYGDREVGPVVDHWISEDLESGKLVDAVDAGRHLVMSAHAQCITAMNTGDGLRALTTIVQRLTGMALR